jgi:sulfur-oxidizing protein SoxZ
MARALVNAPKRAKRGEMMEIRTLISHPMETGFRPGPDGRLQPRDIITDLVCDYDGETVFRAELHPATSANPYLVFRTVATRSGPLRLTWRGDNGFEQTETVEITVE